MNGQIRLCEKSMTFETGAQSGEFDLNAHAPFDHHIHYTNLTFVRESGRSREAIRPGW